MGYPSVRQSLPRNIQAAEMGRSFQGDAHAVTLRPPLTRQLANVPRILSCSNK